MSDFVYSGNDKESSRKAIIIRRDRDRTLTRATMFETRGIPFILLDIVCLVLGKYHFASLFIHSFI